MGNKQVIELLINAGVGINEISHAEYKPLGYRDLTPLLLALSLGRTEIAELLIAHGATV